MFHRALGLVRPKDVDSEHFEITYVSTISHPNSISTSFFLFLRVALSTTVQNLGFQVQCGDTELEKKIEEKVEQFCSWAEKHPNKKGQVSQFSSLTLSIRN